MLFIGALGSVGSGASFPIMMIVFTDMVDNFVYNPTISCQKYSETKFLGELLKMLCFY
jgi:hypothetical protein